MYRILWNIIHTFASVLTRKTIMESTIQEKKPGTNINTADALWAIISAQPRKVRKELAIRLQDEFPTKNRHATGLDEALEDIKEGRMSGPFCTPEELFEHLQV